MPLPQKVIEQLGREPARTPGWSGRFLMFSSTMCFIALGVYFGITFGYKPVLDSQRRDLELRQKTAEEAVSAAERDQVGVFYSQLSNVKIILERHAFVSRIFDWLERNTHENIAYGDFSFNRKENTVALTGEALTVGDFVEQVKRFESLPDEVLSASFEELSADEGRWTWSGELRLADAVFAGIPYVSETVPAEGGEAGAEEGVWEGADAATEGTGDAVGTEAASDEEQL